MMKSRSYRNRQNQPVVQVRAKSQQGLLKSVTVLALALRVASKSAGVRPPLSRRDCI